MNQKLKYEMTIAEKLEQLTVPDMVDAIWSRIEAQLDIDLPTDEGPSAPPSNPPAGGGSWIRPAFIIAITAFIVTLFFTYKKMPGTGSQPSGIEQSPTIVEPVDNNTGNLPPPSGGNILPGQTQARGNTSQGTPVQDSQAGTVTGGIPALTSDSMNNRAGPGNNPVISPPLVIDRPDTSKKKSRGVKGITDDDYRVVPSKKDSTR